MTQQFKDASRDLWHYRQAMMDQFSAGLEEVEAMLARDELVGFSATAYQVLVDRYEQALGGLIQHHVRVEDPSHGSEEASDLPTKWQSTCRSDETDQELLMEYQYAFLILLSFRATLMSRLPGDQRGEGSPAYQLYALLGTLYPERAEAGLSHHV